MIKYELIPHTADIRLKVSGATQEELFSAALQGMASIISPDSIRNLAKKCVAGKNKTAETKEIKIKSFDVTSLLIDFLSEVLTTSYVRKTVFYEIDFLKFTENELHSVIRGAKVNTFCEDIKAVTYHEANVCKNSLGDLQTVIVFDL